MTLADIARVLFAPHKVFKQIIQNPKYLGAIVVLVIFVVAQTMFLYSENTKIHYEMTEPSYVSNIDNLSYWTQNSTLWQSSGAISNNTLDYLSSDTNLYGASSLQFSISNSSALSMALSNIGTVDCGPNGFKNFSFRAKLTSPQVLPSSVNLTLYSNLDANNFKYDLTSQFASSIAGIWNNLTIPVGASAEGWQSSGSPNWAAVTAVKLDFGYADNSTITMQLQGVFFRGVYKTQIEFDSTTFWIGALQSALMQALLQWIVISAVFFILIKVMKGNIVWKPLFIAVGFALIVMVLRSAINIAATATLPTVNLPVELYGVANEASVAFSNVQTMLATFNAVYFGVLVLSFAWMGLLGAFITSALVPEFPKGKVAAIAIASMVLVYFLLILLGQFGFTAL